jgi:hypothetical protein
MFPISCMKAEPPPITPLILAAELSYTTPQSKTHRGHQAESAELPRFMTIPLPDLCKECRALAASFSGI